MWEEGVRIYGTPGVPNNFPKIIIMDISVQFIIFTFYDELITNKVL